ncbi:ATP-binding cassette domain-containing protein [Brumicola blandensis]|uniref:ATP-binding cassette domain-containing protein n=1 Tax=Brumicola blandensis TaxID=3075611 RepID=A0AAW8QYM3_9ALTE|nr:ATP-binding cassette domain-containing protein [Alteromonas sp. W409]MDT0581091.1 ATP-binding cassette domain-containing protein [Alteromonas sp. W409]
MKPTAMLQARKLCLHNRFEDINLSLNRGECWHVLGQNGAGKSSLFDVLSGLTEANVGDVIYDGRALSDISISERATTRAYLQQTYSLAFSLSVSELLSFYLDQSTLFQQHTTPSSIPDILVPTELDEALHVNALLDRPLNELSGGEQQRVHIARVLLQVWPAIQQGEAILLMDEPLQNLDIAFQESVLILFKTLVVMGNLLVMSVHDVNLSLRFADKVLLLKQGKCQASGENKAMLTASGVTELYEYPFELLQLNNNIEKTFIRRPN